MRIDAGNAGRMLRAVDLYSKIQGGDFRLSVDLPPPGAKSSLDGELKLKRFRVRNEAAFREIPQGRARSDGVFAKASRANTFDFSSLKIPFKTRGDELRIRNALLKGNAIGASADGSVNTKTDAIRLGGTLIPAYGLNSIVSHVPLIGDILAGGKGKGVFGVDIRGHRHDRASAHHHQSGVRAGSRPPEAHVRVRRQSGCAGAGQPRLEERSGLPLIPASYAVFSSA